MQASVLKALIGKDGPLSGKAIKHCLPVTGGCIHQAWQLTLEDGRKIFAKTNVPRTIPMLKFEAEGLEALRTYAPQDFLIVPKPLAINQFEDAAVLLLPWLNFGSGDHFNLGRGLAMLHKSSSKKSPAKFGWGIDGFIGTGPQPGGWQDHWGQCFVKLRLIPQLKIARKWGLNVDELNKLLTTITLFLNEHDPSPSLVHGDLWSGNCGIEGDQKGILIDPAPWWADREVDIAMTMLFGSFAENFYKGYESVWPLSKTANLRLDIYNLYHLLNHANIFGGSYQNQCLSIIKQIKSTINN